MYLLSEFPDTFTEPKKVNYSSYRNFSGHPNSFSWNPYSWKVEHPSEKCTKRFMESLSFSTMAIMVGEVAVAHSSEFLNWELSIYRAFNFRVKHVDLSWDNNLLNVSFILPLITLKLHLRTMEYCPFYMCKYHLLLFTEGCIIGSFLNS